MHACLYIQEILLDIFAEVLQLRYGYRGVASLARTCRLFMEPALDVLWATQHSLVPLVMCFPSYFLQFKSEKQSNSGVRTVVGIRGVPDKAAWEKLFFYTRRIKTLHADLIDRDNQKSMSAVHFSVLSKMLCACQKHLLPNLRALSFPGALQHFALETCVEYANTINRMILLSAMEPSTLTSLTCPLYSVHPLEADKLVTAITTCSFLENLTMFAPVELQTLYLYEILQKLTALKCLSTLAIHLHESSWIQSPEHLGAFPSLQSVELRNFPSQFVLPVIRSIHCPSLVSLRIGVTGFALPHDLHDLMAEIATRTSWKESLKSISLSAKLMESSVRSLLPFTSLQHVFLSDIRLTPSDGLIRDMAMAWPALETLHILYTIVATPLVGNIRRNTVSCSALS
ncbi:hypothetical protein BU15DRAFT_79926 [Melanogaster broomeanus]|nr:hypothetical protein BU15DRAFT_79926 [Melanogaster broomeanus]